MPSCSEYNIPGCGCWVSWVRPWCVDCDVSNVCTVWRSRHLQHMHCNVNAHVSLNVNCHLTVRTRMTFANIEPSDAFLDMFWIVNSLRSLWWRTLWSDMQVLRLSWMSNQVRVRVRVHAYVRVVECWRCPKSWGAVWLLRGSKWPWTQYAHSRGTYGIMLSSTVGCVCWSGPELFSTKYCAISLLKWLPQTLSWQLSRQRFL